jgi:signal transduction histidine kinase
MKTRTNSEHLWWVVLLLAAAVILPTVCLLWFMTAAVRNERLAVRQKLVDSYTGRAEALVAVLAQNWTARKAELLTQSETLRQKSSIEKIPPSFAGVVVFDEKGGLIYPTVDKTQEMETPHASASLQNAWRLEFVNKQYVQAAQAYEQIIDPNAAPALRQTALAGQARCLSKDGKLAEAKTLYEQLAKSATEEKTDPAVTAQSRIRLAQIYLTTLDPRFVPYCREILQGQLTDLNISATSRVYLLGQILALVEKAGVMDKLSEVVQQAQACLAFEQTSIQAAEAISTKPAVIQDYGVYRINDALYGCVLTQDGRRMIGLIAGEKLAGELTAAAKELDDNIVFYRLYDSAGKWICGQPEVWVGVKVVEIGLFLTMPLSDIYSGWKLELYFRDGVFQAAAGRQQMIYIWSSALAIGLMLIFVFFAGREILRQARLNRLKNTFVATVTHELKTPLSSMRLLVDTLLNGNYTNQQQCKEYLELISHENERLSRMIDSFLTFSRMERNKQVFDFKPISPCEIVSAAAEAIGPKMSPPGCHFSVSMGENLPQIMVDKDAMVTVLVNLLDNAYKYSGANKTIELKVYGENGKVCFSIKDDGVGIPRRIQKKIFDRFYQADSHLSRRTEGCGLGLSIVKFIVSAHKGTIDVESKVGVGSVFTIRIPAMSPKV